MDNGFERRNRFEEFILPVIGETDVEPDARYLRHQVLRFLESVQSFCPLAAPHIDDAEIGVGSARLRVDLQHLPEIVFGFVEVPM